METSVDEFNSSAFKAALARNLGSGITANDVTLNVTAASLRIVATVAVRDADLAGEVRSKLAVLAESSTAEVSASLGVVVTESGHVTQSVVPSTESLGLSDGSGIANAGGPSVAIGIGTGVLVVALLLTGFVWRASRARKVTQLLATYPTSSPGLMPKPSPAKSDAICETKDSLHGYL